MVCPYCSNPTQVKNSRPHDKNYAIWRRRACAACETVFTTEERPLLSTAFVVEHQDSSFTPFNNERLFISIYESCKHREQPIEDARSLTRTIIAHLLQSPNKKPGSIAVSDIITIATRTLQDFDSAAASYYKAYYAK